MGKQLLNNTVWEGFLGKQQLNNMSEWLMGKQLLNNTVSEWLPGKQLLNDNQVRKSHAEKAGEGQAVWLGCCNDLWRRAALQPRAGRTEGKGCYTDRLEGVRREAAVMVTGSDWHWHTKGNANTWPPEEPATKTNLYWQCQLIFTATDGFRDANHPSAWANHNKYTVKSDSWPLLPKVGFWVPITH